MKTQQSQSDFQHKQHFQYQAKLFLNKGSLEVVIGQQDVHKWQNIEVKEEAQWADQLKGEHVSAKQELNGDDNKNIGNKLDKPCPEGHVDVDQVSFATSADDICQDELNSSRIHCLTLTFTSILLFQRLIWLLQ